MSPGPKRILRLLQLSAQSNPEERRLEELRLDGEKLARMGFWTPPPDQNWTVG